MPSPVGLEFGPGPDPLDRDDRDPGPGGHPASAPLCRPLERRLEGERDDPVPVPAAKGRRSARSRRVARASGPLGLTAPADPLLRPSRPCGRRASRSDSLITTEGLDGSARRVSQLPS